MTARDPAFAIPAHPTRSYPRSGGLEYEGEVVFELRPATELTDSDLEGLVDTILEVDVYRWGDFLELPMVLYLVRDEDTGDVFRVAVRDGTVRLYVLPATESEGLRRFYERLREASDCEWSVERHADVE